MKAHRLSTFAALPLRNILLLFLSALSAFSALTLDATVITTPLIEEGPPRLDGAYPLWFILLVSSSILFVTAIAHWPETAAMERGSAAQDTPAPAWPAWAMLLLSITCVLVFLVNPKVFYALAMEDWEVETLSAAAAFAAGGVFLRTAWVLTRHRADNGLLAAGTVGLAAILLLLALEEISWFQRVFVVETPNWARGNEQSELNLHNFFTDATENAYYFGAFTFLVVAPFVHDHTTLFKRWTPAAFFIPSRSVLFTAAIAFAWNYDMWNIVFTQISFWTTFFVLAWYSWKMRAARGRALAWALIVTYFLTQLVFVARGATFVRIWDVTEYKELFIPLAFLAYAVETLREARNVASRPA